MGKALPWADSASHNEPKLLYGRYHRYRYSMLTPSCPTRSYYPPSRPDPGFPLHSTPLSSSDRQPCQAFDRKTQNGYMEMLPGA